MDLILHDWKHSLITETFQMKNLFYTCKGTRKVKDFQKTSNNKEIYFTFQSNSTK